ncbi:MAG: HEAT repeat domain-containing protein, partial [Phycisphaeraceae bacterium]
DARAAKPALETLKEHLRSPIYSRRSAALTAAQTLGPHAADLLPAIIEAAKLEKYRRPHMDAIAAMGPAAAQAVPYLLEVLHSKDQADVRERAAMALGAIGAKAAAAVPDLIKAMRHEEHVISYAAIDALGQMGDASADAVPVMIKLLEQPFGAGEDGRHHVLRALAKLGPKLAAQAGPAAAQIISGREGAKLKATAAQTLPKFCPDPPKGLIEEMTSLAGDRDFRLG